MPTSSFPWRTLLLVLLPLVLQWSFDQPEVPPHLDRFSLVPLLYAILTAVFFHHVGIWIFQQDSEEHSPALAARLVAGILAGVPLVFLLQWAALTAPLGGVLAPGAANPVILVFLTLLGLGYSLIANPLVGFWPALFGYVVSVGMAEETTKALIATREFSGSLRDRLASGFAAGVGFGIGEALLYCYRDYNGHSSWQLYLVRFLYCVGSHGCMSATAALFLADTPRELRRWRRMYYQLLLILPVAFLHGLYDVILDRGEPRYAVLVGFLICAAPAIGLWFYERRAEEGIVD